MNESSFSGAGIGAQKIQFSDFDDLVAVLGSNEYENHGWLGPAGLVATTLHF